MDGSANVGTTHDVLGDVAANAVLLPLAVATEALALLREFRADWSATATPADIEQAYGSAEAEMCTRVDAAISALAPVVAEGGGS